MTVNSCDCISTFHGACICGEKFIRPADRELEFECGKCGRVICLEFWVADYGKEKAREGRK